MSVTVTEGGGTGVIVSVTPRRTTWANVKRKFLKERGLKDSNVTLYFKDTVLKSEDTVQAEHVGKSIDAEWIIERIDYYDPAKKLFRVKWQGFPNTTLEPFENLKFSQALKDFYNRNLEAASREEPSSRVYKYLRRSELENNLDAHVINEAGVPELLIPYPNIIVGHLEFYYPMGYSEKMFFDKFVDGDKVHRLRDKINWRSTISVLEKSIGDLIITPKQPNPRYAEYLFGYWSAFVTKDMKVAFDSRLQEVTEAYNMHMNKLWRKFYEAHSGRTKPTFESSVSFVNDDTTISHDSLAFSGQQMVTSDFDRMIDQLLWTMCQVIQVFKYEYFVEGPRLHSGKISLKSSIFQQLKDDLLEDFGKIVSQKAALTQKVNMELSDLCADIWNEENAQHRKELMRLLWNNLRHDDMSDESESAKLDLFSYRMMPVLETMKLSASKLPGNTQKQWQHNDAISVSWNRADKIGFHIKNSFPEGAGRPSF